MWGGHVVRPFGAVFQIVHGRVVSWRHKAAEEGLQVCLHVGVGILLHHKGTGCVLAEQGQQAIAYACASQETPHGGGKLIEALPGCPERDGLLHVIALFSNGPGLVEQAGPSLHGC